MDQPSGSAAPGAGLATLLDLAARGNRDAFDRVFALLYEELSMLARAQRGRWHGNETLNTTVLVHEAYLKLAGAAERKLDPAGPDQVSWQGRRHFFAIAAQVMRQVLVNYAEAQRSLKRGGEATRVPLEQLESDPGSIARSTGTEAREAEEVLTLHEALIRLAAVDARQARIVECRFFGGMSIPETAEALDISPATVKRDWQLANAWLRQELKSRGGCVT